MRLDEALLIVEKENHWKDQLKGGRADKKKPSDFDDDALKVGIKHELEHTDKSDVAKEIAMDHLAEDPNYYDKLKKVENEDFSVVEGDDSFVDYAQGQRHPLLQQKRDDLKKSVEFLTKTLDTSGTPQMKRISDELKGIHDLPTDQLQAKLASAHELLHKAKRDLAKPLPAGVQLSPDQKSNFERMKGDSKAIGDALLAMPSIFKISSELAKGDKSDKGLWNTKISGYVDDKSGNFVRKGTTTYPAGQDAPVKMSKKDQEAQAAATATANRVDQRIKPMIRPQGNDPFAAKGPVKPSLSPDRLAKVGPTIRKKQESAWHEAANLFEEKNDVWESLARLVEADGDSNASTPKLPVDYKRSLKKARKTIAKAGIQQPIDVPKYPKAPPKPGPMRATGAAEGDPFKASSNAEVYSTAGQPGNSKSGDYILYKTLGSNRYIALFVGHEAPFKTRSLGDFANRAEAVDAALHDHDKNAAGIGEQKEDDGKDHDFR